MPSPLVDWYNIALMLGMLIQHLAVVGYYLTSSELGEIHCSQTDVKVDSPEICLFFSLGHFLSVCLEGIRNTKGIQAYSGVTHSWRPDRKTDGQAYLLYRTIC